MLRGYINAAERATADAQLPKLLVEGLFYTAHGSLRRPGANVVLPTLTPGTRKIEYTMGEQRAHAEAQQRGLVSAVEDLIESGGFCTG